MPSSACVQFQRTPNISFWLGKPLSSRAAALLLTEQCASSLLPASGNQFWAASSAPENTGDGINMALRAGAALIASCSYFDRFCALLPQKYNGIRLGVPLSCIGSPHSILVDNFGRRFTSESELRDQEQHYGFYQELLQFDPATLSFPRAPVWLNF